MDLEHHLNHSTLTKPLLNNAYDFRTPIQCSSRDWLTSMQMTPTTPLRGEKETASKHSLNFALSYRVQEDRNVRSKKL